MQELGSTEDVEEIEVVELLKYVSSLKGADCNNYTGMDKTSLDTSSRTLFVREGGRMSTSRRTSSYVITYHCSA